MDKETIERRSLLGLSWTNQPTQTKGGLVLSLKGRGVDFTGTAKQIQNELYRVTRLNQGNDWTFCLSRHGREIVGWSPENTVPMMEARSRDSMRLMLDTLTAEGELKGVEVALGDSMQD